ncbi:carnitine O-palmitoyltransferase 2, mitochondrial-like [Centruroides sculpturatus]|uniref:carnitine O-palmitoyltransferase 2, mitochondrial-like n=1 Tax=Centruroides sculpturatus TaxID=218467 RepID=UPI000C6DE90E|nr:carnitine O-palmitoyltransferase 2, mitochondrial-like [Centruroides sculpturatus]
MNRLLNYNRWNVKNLIESYTPCMFTNYKKFSSHNEQNYQFLQQSIVPTMHFQASLPRLPIPELEKTCERYLNAVKPITSEEEFKRTQGIVESFKNNIGKVLHEELIELDKKNKFTSYISGPWFDMYLKSRTPVVLNFNPFLSFKNDSKPAYNDQLIRATNMLISSLRFFKSLRAEILEPEVFHLNPEKSDTPFFRKIVRFFPKSISWYGAYLFKAFPLDMSQFHNLFNSTRIPHQNKDEIRRNSAGRHILVLRKGHFYVFDVLDNEGNIFPPSYIHACLNYIMKDKHPTVLDSIGVLTTENRDTWASVRKHLENLGNGEQLKLIDSALYALILDDEDWGDDKVKLAHEMLHGPAENRWFDKSFQLIINKGGVACINFEHSWGDGVAVLRFFNEIFNDSTTNHHIHPHSIPANLDVTQKVKVLEFKVDETVKQAIHIAQENYHKLTSNLNIDIMQYFKMNRDYLKNQKISPDSIMQLAIQMAFYKQNNKIPATYESCSTSAFKHGRTETVRSATTATKTCVEAFTKKKNKPSPSELRTMLNDCSKIHNQLTKEAAMGQGFDRHLFAMKYYIEKKGEKLPEIYQDSTYIKANHFHLSTSTLYGTAFSGGGFGPVVEDGYGVAYGFHDELPGCAVSSYSTYRNGREFAECIESCLNDIYQVLNATRKIDG